MSSVPSFCNCNGQADALDNEVPKLGYAAQLFRVATTQYCSRNHDQYHSVSIIALISALTACDA
eukprot:scaffold31969_cov44-Cyclotella_meneghiniana.AAC.1